MKGGRKKEKIDRDGKHVKGGTEKPEAVLRRPESPLISRPVFEEKIRRGGEWRRMTDFSPWRGSWGDVEESNCVQSFLSVQSDDGPPAICYLQRNQTSGCTGRQRVDQKS